MEGVQGNRLDSHRQQLTDIPTEIVATQTAVPLDEYRGNYGSAPEPARNDLYSIEPGPGCYWTRRASLPPTVLQPGGRCRAQSDSSRCSLCYACGNQERNLSRPEFTNAPITEGVLVLKVIVIGDCCVGKTSFVGRYVYDRQLTGYQYTIGVDFALKVVHWSDNLSIKLQLWDIAGQERFTSMTRVYYKDARACIIMFDLSQRSTYLNALKWKNDLDLKCTLPDGNPVPCILLANKCDLNMREVQQEEIESFTHEHGFIGWTEISVKENLMIQESMQYLLEKVMEQCGTLEDSGTQDDINRIALARQQSESESKCIC